MSVPAENSSTVNLQPGACWNSFEQFRTSGAKALASINEGKVGTLQTKTGQYRILEERDFQRLVGLARDVERLRGGLNCVYQAVRVVQKHPDRESIDLLLANVSLLGKLPELPIRESFEALEPENLETDPDDEVLLDPECIEHLALS
ncbi:hypothetical protein [Oscillatoria sp. FACHB-1406]|uniref:hypothetical protein n=1 Tax=Oscillatoria sp. FACHB-1406 TaxID=2692846 RepID=UPI0016826A7C|nr:hypothetical protein [Oscillatoria sp. FACHB-1406]MBD2577680.1 hypothetical protein [Oscillatoria sp. FACHB-1406]